MREAPLRDSLTNMQDKVAAQFGEHPELSHFHQVLNPDLAVIPEYEIDSGGYVIDTLTAAIWCLLTTATFADCVLKAVNLGGDTDTTGCVAGGLAGVLYGMEAIPADWRATLPRQEDLKTLFAQFTRNIQT